MTGGQVNLLLNFQYRKAVLAAGRNRPSLKLQKIEEVEKDELEKRTAFLQPVAVNAAASDLRQSRGMKKSLKEECHAKAR
jgi:hypothetical protein